MHELIVFHPHIVDITGYVGSDCHHIRTDTGVSSPGRVEVVARHVVAEKTGDSEQDERKQYTDDVSIGSSSAHARDHRDPILRRLSVPGVLLRAAGAQLLRGSAGRRRPNAGAVTLQERVPLDMLLATERVHDRCLETLGYRQKLPEARSSSLSSSASTER